MEEDGACASSCSASLLLCIIADMRKRQDGDYSSIYDLAKALMTVQRAFGTIPRIIGKGDSAQVRLARLRSLRSTHG